MAYTPCFYGPKQSSQAAPNAPAAEMQSIAGGFPPMSRIQTQQHTCRGVNPSTETQVKSRTARSLKIAYHFCPSTAQSVSAGEAEASSAGEQLAKE